MDETSTPDPPVDGRRGPAGQQAVALDWLLCGNRQGLISLEPLPLETELRSILAAPREVVRRTLRQLAASGLVQRLRSVGTSVPGSAAKSLGCSWNPSAHRYRLLEIEYVPGNRVSMELFGPAGGQLVRVDRLTYSSSGTPVTFSSLYLPQETAEPMLSTTDWNAPSVRVISGHCTSPVRVLYEMTAVALDERAANLLEVVPGSPALHMQRLFSTDEGNVAVSFSRQPGIRVTFGTSMTLPDFE